MPKRPRKALKRPKLPANIQRQRLAETTAGSTQTTSMIARRMPEPGKPLLKNDAKAKPIECWNTSEPTVKMKVMPRLAANVGDETTAT
jgi:hypothetical protein